MPLGQWARLERELLVQLALRDLQVQQDQRVQRALELPAQPVALVPRVQRVPREPLVQRVFREKWVQPAPRVLKASRVLLGLRASLVPLVSKGRRVSLVLRVPMALQGPCRTTTKEPGMALLVTPCTMRSHIRDRYIGCRPQAAGPLEVLLLATTGSYSYLLAPPVRKARLVPLVLRAKQERRVPRALRVQQDLKVSLALPARKVRRVLGELPVQPA